jgi:hypothetical protein
MRLRRVSCFFVVVVVLVLGTVRFGESQSGLRSSASPSVLRTSWCTTVATSTSGTALQEPPGSWSGSTPLAT